MKTLPHLERLDIRLSSENKGLIAQAAELAGLNLTKFTLLTLVEKARQVVDRHAVVKMSSSDRDKFFSLLDNPPKPSDALNRAAQRHRESVAE